MTLLIGLAPIAGATCTRVILGSFPSPRSLELGEYYANPRNRFWVVMGEIFGIDPRAPYRDRVEVLSARGIAIWDVLQSCERVGALDSAIVRGTEVSNDFRSFFQAYPKLSAIAFNGQKAAAIFQRRALPDLDSVAPHRMLTLPSTSASNVSSRLPDLVAAWRAALVAQ
jgi:hypoxanthine-DNA glycosylase